MQLQRGEGSQETNKEHHLPSPLTPPLRCSFLHQRKGFIFSFSLPNICSVPRYCAEWGRECVAGRLPVDLEKVTPRKGVTLAGSDGEPIKVRSTLDGLQPTVGHPGKNPPHKGACNPPGLYLYCGSPRPADTSRVLSSPESGSFSIALETKPTPIAWSHPGTRGAPTPGGLPAPKDQKKKAGNECGSLSAVFLCIPLGGVLIAI